MLVKLQSDMTNCDVKKSLKKSRADEYDLASLSLVKFLPSWTPGTCAGVKTMRTAVSVFVHDFQSLKT